MNNLYLILAATAVIATCAPKNNFNDIIWYPVEDDDGVFISVYGEKHKTSQNSKWRTHSRHARFSGFEPSWPFDPTENHDPSFFHNINERRPVVPVSTVPYFQNQQFNRPYESQNSNYREALNEVFGDNKFISEYQSGRPGGNNFWGNGIPPKNPWNGNSGFQNNNNNNNNQWNRPPFWGTTSGFPGNGLPWQQQWETSTTSRPSETEWITKRPTGSSSSNRPTNQPDKLIFPDEEETTSTTVSMNLIPADPTTRSPCEVMCPVTPEFNPVCGTDGSTYNNAGRLKCAQSCGKDVKLAHYGRCGRPPFITPLLPKNPRRRKESVKFSQFW